MRHYKKGRKLGTDSSHTSAMKKNLAVALFTNDRIKTTVPRAKEVRGYVDRIITWAKKGDLHSRRLAIAALGDKELVREVFEKAEQGMWADRNGGYTRILKLGPRKGDNAPMAIIEIVEEAVVPKSKKDEKLAKKGAKSSSKSTKKPNAKKDKKSDEGKEDTAVDEAKEAQELEDKAASNKLDQTPYENLEEAGEIAEEQFEDGVKYVNGEEGIDDIEAFAGGQEALAEEVATSDKQDADLEAERACEEEKIEKDGLEAQKEEIEKEEADNIEKIKEEVAREESELLQDVDAVAKEKAMTEDAIEKAEKHED